ncbi:hypothetical protein NCC78_29405, partial [Micromonospora phytophila]|uniref:hypothetical protein n=1 Tax=Micromonospora phytophila TaxID=709888 RepID=UPI002030DDB7
RGQRRDGPGGPASGTPADAHLPPRRALATAASVAGVLVLVAAGIQSPSDREPELDLAAVATGLLLAVLAIGCALAAAPARTVARWRLAAGLGATVTVAVGLVRAVPPVDRVPPQLALGAVLLTGVTLLAWDWPGGRPVWRWHAVAALAAFIAPYAMLLVTVLFTLPLKVGASFTALAGNSAINAADSDVLLSLCGVLAGLGMALLLAWPPALGQRPTPGDPPRPEAPPGPREASAERR